MTDFKKIFALASAALLALTAAAAPVSKEYVDNRVTEVRSDITNVSNKLDEAVSDLESKIAIGSTSQHYIYDDQSKPSTNLLDAAGQLFGLSLEEGRERGGVWQVSIVSNQVATTYFAKFIEQDGNVFRWSTNSVFDVELNLTNGEIVVTSYFNPQTNGTYRCDAGSDPLEDKLESFSYESGYEFVSLQFTRQGPSVKADQPYDKFVRKSAYDSDRSNHTVTGIKVNNGNMQHGDVSLTIPDTTNLATKQETAAAEDRAKAHAETYAKNKLYNTDAFDGNIYTPTSVVGRLNALEQTSQEIKHNVVYDLWSADRKQIIGGTGKKYLTHNEPYGAWEMVTTDLIKVYTNGTWSAETSLWTWKYYGNSYITYCPTNGAVCYDGIFVDNVATNLNPEVDDLGTVRNESVASGNRLTFVMAGEVRNPDVNDYLVFRSELAMRTVTGLRVDEETYLGGAPLFRHGDVTLPNYSAMINAVKNQDMETYWTSYTSNSIVGRVKTLEGGGANKAYLNQSPITDFTTGMNDASIVGNIMALKADYTTHQSSTNIAGYVATNSIDARVTKPFIKDLGFYDSNTVNTLIFEKVEQKRADYIYDNVDNPTQVMDSEGRLFRFGIEDLGGRFTATESSIGDEALGTYYYKGLGQGTNRWTNAYAKVIWYEPATGRMGDPGTVYEGAAEPGLMPTNCAAIPNIDSAYLKAAFTPQATTVPHPYSASYDEFARKSETDKIFAYTLDEATNAVPKMWLGGETKARAFNPLFQTSGQFYELTTDDPIWQPFSADNVIRIPADTREHSVFELGFDAKIPMAAAYKQYQFLVPSSVESLPAIGVTNIYNNIYDSNHKLFSLYPGRTEYAERPPFALNTAVRFRLQKHGMNTTLFATNLVGGGAAKTFTLPNNFNVAPRDWIEIRVSDIAAVAASQQMFVDLNSVYVKYGDDGARQKLVGPWAESYKKTSSLYADEGLHDGSSVILKKATADRYGVVMPDGQTIRINAETGKLEADAGGVDLQQVIDVIAKTNTTDIVGAVPSSVVGRAVNAQTRVGELETQVQELIGTISNLNTRIEAALNGQ